MLNFFKKTFFYKILQIKPKNIYDIKNMVSLTKKYIEKKYIKMKVYKFTIFFIFFYLNFFSVSYSETIKKFNIGGNERVSDETIIMFSNLEIGDKIDQNKLNNALKKLYKKNYFKNIYLSNSSGIINIDVIENPIIQSVEINGIDDNKILENIKKLLLNKKNIHLLKLT